MRTYKTTLVIILQVCFLLLTASSPVLAEEKGNPLYSYTVKGVIVKLPKDGDPKKTLMIKHEAIPDYVDPQGDKVGMSAMTMPFFLSTDLYTNDLKVGDKIEFIFESWWKPKPGDLVTSIKKVE